MSRVRAPVLIIAGPHRGAISGVSTHLNVLLASRRLAACFTLVHFQVGSEGRDESGLQRVLRLLASPFLLAFTILRHGAVLLHLNTSLNTGAYWRDLAYLLVARCCGIRVVYQVHGGALPQDFFRDSAALTGMLRASLRLPDAILVLAQCELAAYRRFLPGSRVICIPNGVDCSAYAASVRAADGQRGITLLYLGRLAREKGLFEALDAMRLARIAGVDAHLVIAGDGAEAGALRTHAQMLGIADAVTFPGPVYGAAKASLFGAADVFLLPSYAEGLPYALLEAMATGLPPIATRVGAIADVVVDGTHGMLVPVRDAPAIAAAIHALAEPSGRARMSAAARARIVGEFCVERVEEDISRLYDALCAPRPDSRRLRRS